MKNIKNVIFDLGGVLVDLDIDRCTAAFRQLGMNRVADLINPCYPAEMIGRLERGDLSFHEACDAMRKLDGRYDVTDAQIAGAYGAFLAGIPVWKLRQVERLRGAGIRTYVLSNNNPASMEVIRGEFTADGHTMDDYFDKVYLSYELRELKPSEGDLPQGDRRQRHRPRTDALHRRRAEERRSGAGTGIRGIHARAGRGFRTPVRRDNRNEIATPHGMPGGRAATRHK